jgi:cytochrome c oxidase subunit IV
MKTRTRNRETRGYYLIAWAVLLLLLGLSVLSAYIHLGIFQPVVQFGIAATQAAIIFIVFMRLRGRPSLKWVFAGAGFLWLLFLYGIGVSDYATRSPPKAGSVAHESQPSAQSFGD